MSYRFELIAIHNHLSSAPITWLSWFLRAATGSFFNHIAVRVLDPETGEIVGVLEAIWPRVKWWDNYGEWERHARRSCKILRPADGRLVPGSLLMKLIGKNYGVFDLLQLGLLIFNVIWCGRKSYTWDGLKGTGLRPGFQCAELGLVVAGEQDPHLAIPGQLLYHPAFELGADFETYKK